jgi:ActR/RegA family two-component response regulator
MNDEGSSESALTHQPTLFFRLTLTEGTRRLLERSFDAVVMVADESSLVESAKRLQPTIAVVDLSLLASESLRWIKCPTKRPKLTRFQIF